MKRTVVANGDEHDVEVRADPDGRGTRITVDSETFTARATPRPDGFDVWVDGEYFDVRVDRPAFGVLEGDVDRTPAEVLYAAQARKLAAGPGRAHTVAAPMPGTVVGVEVEEGDPVEVGDCLLTLEAMKMENEILAEHAGVVAEVRVAAGEPVEGGQVLVVVAPEGGDAEGEEE